MHKRWFWLLPMLIAGWIPTASAQDVWAYAVVGPDNKSTITFRPPVDLTYPPPGAPTPLVGSYQDPLARGVRLTPQEAARRLNAPKVIIMLLPAQQAINIGRMPAQQATNIGTMPAQPTVNIQTTPGY